MSLLEIILLGYLVNIGSFIVVIILLIMDSIFITPFLDKVYIAKRLILLEKSKVELEQTKKEFKIYNKIPFIQEDLVMLFPFAYLIYAIKYIIEFFHLTLIDTIIYQTIYKNNKLRKKLVDIKRGK